MSECCATKPAGYLFCACQEVSNPAPTDWFSAVSALNENLAKKEGK